MNLGQTVSNESTSNKNNKNNNNCQDRFVAKSLSNFPPSHHSLVNVPRRSRSHLSSCLCKCVKGCRNTSDSNVNDPGQQLFEQLLNKQGKVERLLVPDLATEWYRKQKVFIDQVTDAEMDYLNRRAERFEQRNPMRDNYDDLEMDYYRHRRDDPYQCGHNSKGMERTEQNEEEQEEKEEAGQQFASPCTYLSCGCGKCQLQHSAQYQQLCRQQRRSRQYCRKLVRCKYLRPQTKPSKTESELERQRVAQKQLGPLYTKGKHQTVCKTNHNSCAETKRKAGGATASATPSYIRYDPVLPDSRQKKPPPCSYIYQGDGQPMARECVAELQNKCTTLLRRNVRDSPTPRRLRRPERFRRISPEFYKLWQCYEDGLTEKYPLYGKPIRLCPRAKPRCTCEEGLPCNIVMEPIEESEEESLNQMHEAEEPEQEAEQDEEVVELEWELELESESEIYQVCKPGCPGQHCPGPEECPARQVTREERSDLYKRSCSRVNQEGEEQGCQNHQKTAQDQQFQEQRTLRYHHGDLVTQNFVDRKTPQDQHRDIHDRLLSQIFLRDPSDALVKRGNSRDSHEPQDSLTQNEVRSSCLSDPSTERETKRRRGSSVTFDTRIYEAHQRPTSLKRGPPLMPKPIRVSAQQHKSFPASPHATLTRRSPVDKYHGILGNIAMRCKRFLRPGRHLLYNFSKSYHIRNEPKAETSVSSKKCSQLVARQQKLRQQQQEEAKKHQLEIQQQQEKEEEEEEVRQHQQHQDLLLVCVQQEPSKTHHECNASLSPEKAQVAPNNACRALELPQCQHIYPSNAAISQIYVASSSSRPKHASSTNIPSVQRRQQLVKYSPQLLRRKARLFASTSINSTNQGRKPISTRSRQNKMVSHLDRPQQQQRIGANVNRPKATGTETLPTADKANLGRHNGKPKQRALRSSYDEQRHDQLATAVKFALSLPQAKTDAKTIRHTAFSQGASISSQMWNFTNKPKFFLWKKSRWPVTPINSRQSILSMSSLQARIGANNDTSTDTMVKREEKLTNVTYFERDQKQRQVREREDQQKEGDPRRQKDTQAPPQKDQREQKDSREQKETRAPSQKDQREQKDPRGQKETRAPSQKDQREQKDPRGQKETRTPTQKDQREEKDPRGQKENRAPPQKDQREQKDPRGQKETRAPPQKDQRKQKDQGGQENKREQRYPQEKRDPKEKRDLKEKRDAGGQRGPQEQEDYQEQSDRRSQRDPREQQNYQKQRTLTQEYQSHRDSPEKNVSPSENKVLPPVVPRKPRQEFSQAQRNTRDHVAPRETPRLLQDIREQTDHREQRYTQEQRQLQLEQAELSQKQTNPQVQRDFPRQQGARDLPQVVWNSQDHRDRRDQKDSRDQRTPRDPREQPESREIRLFVRDQHDSRQLPRSVSQVIKQKEEVRNGEHPQLTASPIPTVTLSRPSRTLMKTAQQVLQRLETTIGTRQPPPLFLVRSATPTPGLRFNSDRCCNYSDDHINRTRSGRELPFDEEPQNQSRQPLNPQGLGRTCSCRRLAVNLPRPSASVHNLRSASVGPTTSRAAQQVVKGLPQVPLRSVAIPKGSNISYRQLLPINQETNEKGVAAGAGAAPLEERPLPPLSMQRSSYASPASNLPATPKNFINNPLPPRTPGSILKTTPKPVQNPVKRVNFVRERGGSVPPSPWTMEYSKDHSRESHSSSLAPPMTDCCREALKAAKKTNISLFAVASVNSLDEEEEQQKEKPFQLRYTHDRLPRYVDDAHVQREGEPLAPNAPLLTISQIDEEQLPMNAQLLLNEDDYRPLRKAKQGYLAPPVEMVSELGFGTFFHHSHDFNLPEQPETDVDPPEMMTKLMNTLRVRQHGTNMQTKENSGTANIFGIDNDAFYIGSGTGKVGAAAAAAAAAVKENEKSWRNWMHERDPPQPPRMNFTCGERDRDDTYYLPRRRCNLRRLPDDPVVIAPTHSGLRQQQVLQNCLPVLFYGRSDGVGPRCSK